MGLTFKTPNGGRSAMAEANNNRGRFRTYSAPAPKKKKKKKAPVARHRDAYVAPKAEPKKVIAAPKAKPVVKAATPAKTNPLPAAVVKKVVAPKSKALSIGKSKEPANHPSQKKTATIAIKTPAKTKTPISVDAQYEIQTRARDEEIAMESKNKTPPIPARNRDAYVAPKAVNKSTSADAAIELESKRLLKASAQLTADLNKRAAAPVAKAPVIDAPKLIDKGIVNREAAAVKPAAPKAKPKLPNTPPPSAMVALPDTPSPAAKPAVKAPVTAKPVVKPAPSVNYNTDDATETTKSKQLAPKPVTKAPVIAAPKSTGDPRGEPTLHQSTSAPITKPKVDPVIAAPKERINLSKDNKTVAEDPKYDQKYWAGQLAKGVSQADMAAQQKSVGMTKAYSGDKVVTGDMKRRASDDLSRVTGSMATLENGGVTKTEEKSGLLGEKLKTEYNYKGGPVITTKATDPIIGGVRLGDKTSTTFVDGIEVATKTGQDPLGYDAKVTRPDIAGSIDDTTKVDPVVENLNTVTDIQDAIDNTTDKKELAALHRRLRALMRSNRTRTQFGGLRLGSADVESTKLSGTRI